MLGIGIIGCGRITQYRHAPEYLENKSVKLLGFVDTVMSQADLMADKFGGKNYESISNMLNDPAIDAVSVCVANPFHAQVTLEALDAGKHVLLEKPMATTFEDCLAIVKQAKRTGKTVMLGHNQRFAPAHVKAKEMIAQEIIGRPLGFRVTFGHEGPEVWTLNSDSWFIHKNRAGFGVLGDLGIHKIDLIHYLLGEPIIEVSAKLTTLDKRYKDGSLIDLEDNAACLLTTRSGVMGTMHVSWTFNAGEDNSTRIYGTKGVLRLYDDPLYSLIFETKEGAVEKMQLDGLSSNEDQKTGLHSNTGVINAFVDSILKGVQPDIDAQEALKAMRVIFTAIESDKNGKRMEVHQD
ncbi:MAG: Gfo/Idh/MocA family oxidoreductase [Clostridiales bacterium]|nr:Gfo/Idh/MocA family oxidoreductase [Clostridiales bacterium]